LELALALAGAAEDKKAVDIKVLKIDSLTVLSDYFVICSGSSSTHIKTLAEEMEHRLEQMGVSPRGIEGRESGNWLLLDFGSVVAHVFMPETRAFYGLEHLWADGEIVDRGE